MTAPIEIAVFDQAPPADAAAELMPCCASKRWVSELVTQRPYRDLAALTLASDRVLARLSWADVLQALQAHPRIGDRVAGGDRESAWSRQEQAGTAVAADDVAQQLYAANVAYEQLFGHVFLICATGLTASQMLTALRFRLGNSGESEQRAVRAELAKIVRLRLAKGFQ